MNAAAKLTRNLGTALVAAAAWPALLLAQVPVDADGNPIGTTAQAPAAEAATGAENIPLLDSAELEELVGPIALYPDDLLAIVLPASTFPLQIVQAGRFLEQLEEDPSLEPDADWDDSIVALTNYPEVVELLNDDLDWTWRLGEAVVAQQGDVISAIETFRDRAYAAGNLKSDAHQTVARNGGVVEITPVSDNTIYVPYYEPEHVVVHQPRPVYFYYPRPCPVYYYPYASSYAFDRGFFWGVTTAFSIGWYTDRLHVFHHSYHGHPYFGRIYRDRWWYRRPSLHVHNHYYPNTTVNISINRYASGDYWRPQHRRTVRYSDRRITRTRYYPSRDVPRSRRDASMEEPRTANSTLRPATSGRHATRLREAGDRTRRSSGFARTERHADRNRSETPSSAQQRVRPRDAASTIRFRERPSRADSDRRQRRSTSQDTATTRHQVRPPPREVETLRTRNRDVRSQRQSASDTIRHIAGARNDAARTSAPPPRRSQRAAERVTKNQVRSSPPKLSSAPVTTQRAQPQPRTVRAAPRSTPRPPAVNARNTSRGAAKPERRSAKEGASSERRQERPRTRGRLAANARRR